MKNTKFRKRALLSSVAMLLVAILALGSATFAWFTQNTEATADGIYVKTTKASTLLISDDQHGWGTSVTYNQGTNSSSKVMFPASSGDGATWYQAISESETTGAAKTSSIKAITGASGVANANAKYVFANELNVKNGGETGSPAINGITISWSWTGATADYARIALVECTESGTITGAFSSSVYAQNNRTYTGLTATDGTGTSITPSTQTSMTVGTGTLAAGEAKYYKLFVWFEGQDTACIDGNAGQVLNDLEFTVNGTPADN